jgi:nitrite reductase/ring-hydroxylating ferredoxin subunit
MREIRVAAREELTTSGRLFVSVEDREIGILEHEGDLFAYENRCRHQGGPVCEGIILGKVEAVLDPDKHTHGERFSDDTLHLICPWHGWEYDLRSGVCATDATVALRKYEVKERDGNVFLLVPDD